MKVLAIDDQQLVLLPLEKRLTDLGYDVKTTTSSVEGIDLYSAFNPDLVIVDINMPEIPGLDIVRHIRIAQNSQTPIMVLSGNTNDDVITEGFNLGINDYMKKPLSLNEICARVKRLIGAPEIDNVIKTSDDILIQQRCVGVVIPCYNEEERLMSEEFINFIDKNSGYHLCFVNDGSKDNTLEVLKNLKEGREDYITV
ncbi:MAG: response regulator, partial [Bacteroidia bacterium]|nr:response regulator [Bacteroidia bacterium]